jgi:predicted phage tail protein
MLRRIRLYGLAAKTFGPSFELDVASIAEATRALSVQLKGFREFVEKHNFRIVCGSSLKKGWNLGEEEVGFKLPGGDLHVVPVLRGAKRGGIGKIIAGVVLLAAAFFIPVIAPGIASALGGVSAVGSLHFVGSLAAAGLGLIATGISQVMTKTVKPTKQKDDSSFTIDGQLNVTEQGNPVPLIYGRTLVGSTLISAGISTSEYTAASTLSSGTTPEGTQAAGSVVLYNEPTDGDMLILNSFAFTFATAPAHRGQVQISADIGQTIDNLINAIYSADDIRLNGAFYTRSGATLYITFKTPGAVGNGYSMAVASSVIAISGGTLVGGAG